MPPCYGPWHNSLQGQSEQVRAALHIPHIKRDCLLTTALGSAASLVEELRLGPVNRYPAHHGHHTMVPSPRHSVSWSLPSPCFCSRRTASWKLLSFYLFFCLQNYCKESISDSRKSCSSVEMRTGSGKNEPLFPGYDLATIRLLHSSKFRKSVKNGFFIPSFVSCWFSNWLHHSSFLWKSAQLYAI